MWGIHKKFYVPENIVQSFFTMCQNKNTSRRQNLDIAEPDIVILRRECENNAKNIAQSNRTWLFTLFL